MSDDLAAQVRWLHDRELIRDLPQIYAYGIDTRDFDVVASVFHPDCVVAGTLRTEAIERYLKFLEPGVCQYHATMHFMGNQYVRVEGESGHVETYAVAYHIEADDFTSLCTSWRMTLQEVRKSTRYRCYLEFLEDSTHSETMEVKDIADTVVRTESLGFDDLFLPDVRRDLFNEKNSRGSAGAFEEMFLFPSLSSEKNP